MRHLDSEDISALAGLNQRSPLLATTMTLAMVSLAGIPPLAGFFGKFLLLKAVLEQGATNPGYYCLAFTALVGVVISLYYYFGVIRAIYWSKDAPADLSPITLSGPAKVAIAILHRRHVLDRVVSERDGQPRKRSGEGTGPVNLDRTMLQLK